MFKWIDRLSDFFFRHSSRYLELKRKALVLESIVASLPGHVYWKDRHGRYLGCNEGQAKSLGFPSADEVIGRLDAELPWENHTASEFRENDVRIMRSGQEELIEESININGKPGTALSYKIPMRDEYGNVTGILGISFDITDKKATEHALAQAEYQLRGMELVAGTIAHEMRTPLAAVGLSVDSTAKLLQDPDVVACIKPNALARVLKMLARSKQSLQQSHQIINLLLQNISYAEIRVNCSNPVSMTACVEDALEHYAYFHGGPELMHWEGGEDFTFYGDPNLMRNVIHNLMKNALYFIHASGQGEVRIWLEPGKKENKLHIRDTGPGIPADVLPHIFRKFYTENTHHGTGVGLAFCKATMRAHAGDIQVQSVEGEFTEFTLCFPTEAGDPL